jgi:riboflavin biosynthesis pyrimidine reductase
VRTGPPLNPAPHPKAKTGRRAGTGEETAPPRTGAGTGEEALALEQLELLHEAPGLPALALPARLAEVYGGSFGFRSPVVYGNLVSTIDGITALDGETTPAVVADRSTADRFVMGLLRASAEAILVGASTLRAEPRHLWLPEKVCPAGAAGFAELRATLGLPERPRLVVVTASGDLDPALPALAAGATVLTTKEGARHLRSAAAGASSPPPLTVRALSAGPLLDGSLIVAAMREEGLRTVLTEGGPHLIGTLLEARRLDELFLTVSPLFAGDRFVPGRRGVVEGAHFGSKGPGISAGLRRADLLSVRRHGSHLFLRYALASVAPQ